MESKYIIIYTIYQHIKQKGCRMFLARHKWVLITLAILAGGLLVLFGWAVAWMVQRLLDGAIVSGYETQITLLCVVFGLSVIMMVVMYIHQLRKYYYFFKLHRLLAVLMTGREQFDVTSQNGVHYVITGRRPTYQVTASYSGGDYRGVIYIEKDDLFTEKRSLRTEGNMTVAAFDWGRTSMRLCKTLESSGS